MLAWLCSDGTCTSNRKTNSLTLSLLVSCCWTHRPRRGSCPNLCGEALRINTSQCVRFMHLNQWSKRQIPTSRRNMQSKQTQSQIQNRCSDVDIWFAFLFGSVELPQSEALARQRLTIKLHKQQATRLPGTLRPFLVFRWTTSTCF